MYKKFEKLNEEKKNLIIKSAIDEFSKGYYKALTDNIAINSNISKGSLFNYFTSKKYLYIYVVKYCMEFMSSKIKSNYQDIDSKDFFEIIKMTSIYKQKLFIKYPNETKIVMDTLKNEVEEVRDDIRDIMKGYHAENMYILQEYVIKYIDKSRLKENLNIEDALFITSSIFESLSKKYIEFLRLENNKSTQDIFSDLDRYAIILKELLYK